VPCGRGLTGSRVGQLADDVVVQFPAAQLLQQLLGLGERLADAGQDGQACGGGANVAVDAERRVGGEVAAVGVDAVGAVQADAADGGQDPATSPALIPTADFFSASVASARVWRAAARVVRKRSRPSVRVSCSQAARTEPA